MMNTINVCFVHFQQEQVCIDTLILKLAMVKIFKVPTYTTHKEKKITEYTPSIP